jgi:Ca-activated chloride channel family protein
MSKTPLSLFARSPKVRRTFALASVVLATGGLVLYKAPASNAYPLNSVHETTLTADGKNAVSFSGPGAHGTFSLSHSKVLSGTSNAVYGELRLSADQDSEQAKVRAPISMAVVLDTSGSMSGEKIEDAKKSVLRLLADMRDEDEIAMVRYSTTSEVIQPLARVGSVRSSLASRIRELTADGGTNIPDGLRGGLRTLDEASKGRVKRIVLVSDGLDSTRTQAENLARNSFSSGITVSSLGIGNDFDEAYMGAVAQNGHGNFAFIKEGTSLANFLKRELEESSKTTIENARVQVTLPPGMHFVSATGADATVNGNTVDLRIGALFAGDEQRIILELTSDGTSANVNATASWNRVGGDGATASIPTLSVVATNDSSDVEKGRDGKVFASAVSVTSSKRQLEAADAFARGDVQRAQTIAAANEVALSNAAAAAPEAAPAIMAQKNAYSEQKKGFATLAPASPKAKVMAKSAAEKDMGNLRRATTF